MKINRWNFESNMVFLKKTKIIPKWSHILEIWSWTWHMVKQLQDEGYNIIWSEIRDDYILFSKENFGVNLIKAEWKKLPFQDHTFDIILSFDVFEHIPNTDEHLNEVKRLLKKWGYYLLQTPNKLTNIPFEIIKERSFIKYKSYHCSLHNYRQIKDRFRKHWFEITFINIPIVNNFFKEKVEKYFWKLWLFLLKVINIDKLPIFLKTNFYIVAKT